MAFLLLTFFTEIDIRRVYVDSIKFNIIINTTLLFVINKMFGVSLVYLIGYSTGIYMMFGLFVSWFIILCVNIFRRCVRNIMWIRGKDIIVMDVTVFAICGLILMLRYFMMCAVRFGNGLAHVTGIVLGMIYALCLYRGVL